jgi:hypothetical protein
MVPAGNTTSDANALPVSADKRLLCASTFLTGLAMADSFQNWITRYFVVDFSAKTGSVIGDHCELVAEKN